MEDELISVKEAAARLGVSKPTMIRIIKDGNIPKTQNPVDKRERLIPASALSEYRPKQRKEVEAQ